MTRAGANELVGGGQWGGKGGWRTSDFSLENIFLVINYLVDILTRKVSLRFLSYVLIPVK